MTAQKKCCPNCKSQDLILLNNSYSLYRCDYCGLIFKYIGGINSSKIQKIQNGVYTESLIVGRSHTKMVERMARDRLDILRRYKRSGNLLEIGCASGEFLQVSWNAGFNAIGVDSSKVFCEYAQGKGLNVKHGRIEDFEFPVNYFDVIVLFHLIEHIEEPGTFLRHLSDLLDYGGILFIIAPNVEALTTKIFGWKHPNYTQPDHLYFYSKNTLTHLLFKEGFQTVDILSKEYTHHLFTSLVGFLSSRDFLKTSPRFQKDNVNTHKSHPNRVKSIFRYIYAHGPYTLGTILYPILRPYGLIVERKIRGHELIVIARKREK